MSLLVSIGEWGDGTTRADRVAFAMELRDEGEQFGVGITDALESPWRDATIIGRILDRHEALKHPLVAEVFEIVDHAVAEDVPLRAFFERSASARPN